MYCHSFRSSNSTAFARTWYSLGEAWPCPKDRFVMDGNLSGRRSRRSRPARMSGEGIRGHEHQACSACCATAGAPVQAMAEVVRVDCVLDQRIVCRDDETTCRAPVRELGTYHFTFDLTKKTGSLVFCSPSLGCMEPSPLTVVHDYCAFLRDYGPDCLSGRISVWEPSMQQTYTISNSRYVSTVSGTATDHSYSVTQFGRCAVQ